MATYEVPGPVHRLWTTRHEPVLEVADGDVLTFTAQECSGGQFDDFRNGDPVPELDLDRLYPLVGPVLVRGAEAGDTLELELLDYRAGDWGWTSVIPGMGLLADDFPDAHLHRWELRGGRADFLGAATVPVRPFLGVLGVTPDIDEPRSVIPPGRFGGNLDCRDLTAGSRVLLPVQTPGARLMVGDPHAAQGDGEVCVAAIEAGLSGAIRVRLHKGKAIPAPQFITPGPLRQGIEDRGYYGTMGVAPDLMTASRDAVRAMIDHLCDTTGLAPLDAYVLASVVVDLKISEVVDAPNWVVSAYLPLSVLEH
jgi:acetamidase/formamidase